jgi:hypothetical protein
MEKGDMKVQKLLTAFLAAMLLVGIGGLAGITVRPAHAQQTAACYVGATKTGTTRASIVWYTNNSADKVGATFTVYIDVANFTGGDSGTGNLMGYTIQVNWTTTVLDLVGVHDNLPAGFSSTIVGINENLTVANGNGCSITTLGVPINITGPTDLRDLTFKVLQAPNATTPVVSSAISLEIGAETEFGNDLAELIPTTLTDGAFTFYYSAPPPPPPPPPPSGLTKLYVNPASLISPTLTPAATFSVDIDIVNVTNLYSYQFSLQYASSYLNGLGILIYPTPTNETHFTASFKIDGTQGYALVNVSYYAPALQITSTTPLKLATIFFQVKTYSSSSLHLTNVTLVNGSGKPITFTTVDGFVSSSLPHVGLLVVSASPSSIYVGTNVTVTVVAANLGIWRTETFNVTAYRNSTAIATETVTNLHPLTNTTLSFIWDTAGATVGNYLISATASMVSLETNTTGHYLSDGIVDVYPLPHISLIAISASPTTLYAGTSVTITVTAVNFDVWKSQTFNVTAYWNSTSIGTTTITNLASKTNTTVSFVWNTNGATIGSYIITARATMVPYETNSTGHYISFGVVHITSPTVAVLSVTPSITDVYPLVFWNVNITTVVQNQGALPISFNVTAYAYSAYYNSTITIGSQAVTGLASGSSATVIIVWNMANVPVTYQNYTISSKVSLPLGLVNTAKGSLTSGKTVRVRLVGDVNGDAKVNVLDEIAIENSLNTVRGGKGYNMYADINQDGKVNILDLIYCADNQGAHWP